MYPSYQGLTYTIFRMNEIIEDKKFEALYENIASLIEKAQTRVRTAVNMAMVYTYYGIGYYIVEYEQDGNNRASYGKQVLKRLSERLTTKFHAGWSVEQLKLNRKFYLVYSKKVNTFYPIIENGKSLALKTIEQDKGFLTGIPSPTFPNTISWSHYVQLIRIKNDEERRFYEIECDAQQWSVRELQRQYNSSLYERLALSRDKDEVMRLSQDGQKIDKPKDLLKNPLTLEFLGLKVEEAYSESKLESKIISKLGRFLLELGKGFLFEARQKRFTFNEDHYFIDLVLYNRLLKAYTLIDFKVDKLTHQDIGQMQMYVNYYDRYVKLPDEKPTIGILVCKEKNDAIVELTLPKEANIYAAEYALYLPDKRILQTMLKEWLDEDEYME
mgnify:CR=1 FL=1